MRFIPLAFLPVLYFALAFFGQCQSAKFLFTFFHDKGSHFGSMRPLMERLANRGHSVTFLDTIFSKDVSPSLRHIRATLPTRDDEQWKEEFSKLLWESRLTAPFLIYLYKSMDKLFGTLMQNHTQQVMELVQEDWDFLVLDDLFWSFGFAFATLKHRLWEQHNQNGRQPHIVLYSTAASSLMSAESIRSVGRNWVSRAPMCPYLPTNSEDVFSPNKFAHRVFGLYEILTEFLLLNFVTPILMPNIAKFGVPNFSWHEFFSRTVLQLADSIDRIGWPMAVGSEMFNVGAHCKQPKTLPREFAEFMETPGSNGTIYVAFGTHADWSRAPARVTNAIFGAFNRLSQYRIIFVYNGAPFPGLGAHVMLAKWAPQLEILAHPSVRAFVTHGGNKSVREALCAGIPLVVMPIYAEQAHSAHLLLAMRFAPVINKFTMSEDSVFHTISEVLTNPTSIEQAQKFRVMFLDRPMPAMEQGVFAMERLLRIQHRRLNKAKEMKKDPWRQFTQRRGIHISWAQFILLDWVCVLLAFVLLLSLK